uniref:Armadillo repeat-containing domain-containing protein n=1 Tax=Cuerna arida TaxID=1464854 RepID=A0A1B6GW43_9HEMI
MFTTAERLKDRTGKNNVGRYEFLKQLTEEFKSTVSSDAKHQVMANLANFSYDPINYEHLRSLGVLDLFLENLNEEDVTLTRFALGGLCNLALDPENKEYINDSGGISQISNCLFSTCLETVQYAITSLMFLMTAKYKDEITSDVNIARMLELSQHPDKRIQNLAVIFLDDYCHRDQVHRMRNSVTTIPLPVSQAPTPQ